ncbi:MAG: DNA primase [Pseudomonadota bacterium]
MRFSPSFLQEIRDRIPIADVVGRRVTFDRKKSNQAKGDFWACCPFHGEKSPSFHCENSKGRYHCFGCGASGDHFRFMTELDGLSFPEAVERLADEAGLQLPAVDPQMVEREKKKATLFDVMTLAAEFFQAQLQAPEGAKARAYLRERGLSPAHQNEFGLGFAPSSRYALKEHLSAKGVSKEQIEACGLVVFGPEIAVSYDRFRDRIMFPITDARERVIAFGGRAMAPDAPAKYLNSPETELFSKSNVLYNYARARKEAGRDGSLLVCEGYMDVIALHVAGFKNAVAPLGTALTEQQLQLAWRVGSEPVLCFDGDEAGMRAAGRSLDLILPHYGDGRGAKFISLPDGKDPDDFVKERGAAEFQQVVLNAMPVSEFILHRWLVGASLDSPEDKLRVEKAINEDVARIGDKAMAHHMRQHVRTRLSAVFYGKDHGPVAQHLSFSKESVGMREKLVLGILIEYPTLLDRNFEEFMDIDFKKKQYSKFQKGMYDLLVKLSDYTVSEIYEKIHPQFYGVLEEVHGFPVTAGTDEMTGETVRWSLKRGHRLRINFPMLETDPPIGWVEEYLHILFRQYEEQRMNMELDVTSKWIAEPEKYGMSEDSIYAMYDKQLRDLREHQAETERRIESLDARFRARAGRQAA